MMLSSNNEETKNYLDEVSKGTKKIKYFAYGSNNMKQLKDRTGAICLPIPVVVKDYVRIFSGYSHFWGGGVASIYPCEGEYVNGCLVELTLDELKTLDKYEGGYHKVVVKYLQESDKESGKCITYIKDDPEFIKPPSEKYVKAIKQMLKDVERDNEVPIKIRGVVDKTLKTF